MIAAGDIAAAGGIGFAAGVSSGALGIGGGILFVPALVLVLGQHQVAAESTSLLAIVPVAALGAWRQHRYGNLRLRDGLIVGVLSPVGVGIGTVLANVLPERGLKLAFAAIQLFFAYRLVRRAVEGRGA